jgi:hypothetical protein
MKTNSNVSLTEITRKLKAGEVSRIANETGYSPSHVSNVLAGRRSNNEIVKVAHSLTRRRK